MLNSLQKSTLDDKNNMHLSSLAQKGVGFPSGSK